MCWREYRKRRGRPVNNIKAVGARVIRIASQKTGLAVSVRAARREMPSSFVFVVRFGFLGRSCCSFPVRRRKQQKGDQVVQLGTESRTVVGGHQGLALAREAVEFGLQEKTKLAVQSLELKRKIIFVAHQAGTAAALTRGKITGVPSRFASLGFVISF
jgi:hypothetical protein